jgi:hypothetical protein
VISEQEVEQFELRKTLLVLIFAAQELFASAGTIVLEARALVIRW